jgi:hypothetical protein
MRSRLQMMWKKWRRRTGRPISPLIFRSLEISRRYPYDQIFRMVRFNHPGSNDVGYIRGYFVIYHFEGGIPGIIQLIELCCGKDSTGRWTFNREAFR